MPDPAAPIGTSEPAGPNPRVRRWPPARIVWFTIAAFGIGLLLFALLAWLDRRNDDQFYRAGPRADDGGGQVFEPLPSPEAGGDAVGDAPTSPAAPAARAGANQAPAVAGTIEEAPASSPDAADVDASAPATGQAGIDTAARPLRNPPPRYPAAAMQRGESGSVLLEVDVDATGVPTRVAVARSSRSRLLDREAARAVGGWRFAPATRGGQPVASTVRIPVDFRT